MSEELKLEGIEVQADMREVFKDLTMTQEQLRKVGAHMKDLQQQQNELTMEGLRLEGQARYLQGKITAFQEQAKKVPVELEDKDRQKLTKLLDG